MRSIESAGAWMQTFTGRVFSIDDPQHYAVDIEDIAHALSMLCRYGGHTARFYSVAEHSVHVSLAVPAEYALEGLLHDAAEAYVGDMIRPVKRRCPEYKAIERRVLRAVANRFQLLEPGFDAAAIVEQHLMENERRALLKPLTGLLGEPWAEPLPDVKILCLDQATAKTVFLARYDELLAARIARR